MPMVLGLLACMFFIGIVRDFGRHGVWPLIVVLGVTMLIVRKYGVRKANYNTPEENERSNRDEP